MVFPITPSCARCGNQLYITCGWFTFLLHTMVKEINEELDINVDTISKEEIKRALKA